MSAISPIFPMPETALHFNDYGFEPRMDFFQALGEARRQKRDTTSSRSIDSIHFKLHKPIESKRSGHKKKKKWWKNALLFFKWGRRSSDDGHRSGEASHRSGTFRGPLSSPLYLADSRSGSTTPYRSTTRPSSGPLAGTITPARRGKFEIPYLSLSELNMEAMPQPRMSTSALPIYLVT